MQTLIWSATADPVQSRSLGCVSKMAVIVKMVSKGRVLIDKRLMFYLKGSVGRQSLTCTWLHKTEARIAM